MSDPNPDLQALKQGDEGAWWQAFHTHWRFAYHAALNARAGTTHEEAEDLGMEAFHDLIECIETVKTADGLKPLLVVIAQRRAFSLVRFEAAVKRPKIAVHLDALPAHEADQILNREMADDPRAATEAAELLAVLHEALQCVDATTRELLVGQAVEGLTTQELSLRFDLPAGTVSTKLARGLRSVRASLKRSPKLLKELREFLRFN